MKKNKRRGFAKRNKKGKLPVSEENLPVPEEFAGKLDKQLGDIVPEKQKKQIIERMGGSLFKAEMYQGPFPHPEHVEIYEQYCPGFLDRTVTMAEKAQECRIQQNERIITSPD